MPDIFLYPVPGNFPASDIILRDPTSLVTEGSTPQLESSFGPLIICPKCGSLEIVDKYSPKCRCSAGFGRRRVIYAR